LHASTSATSTVKFNLSYSLFIKQTFPHSTNHVVVPCHQIRLT